MTHKLVHRFIDKFWLPVLIVLCIVAPFEVYRTWRRKWPL